VPLADIDRREDVDGATRVAAEIAPFVGVFPGCGQAFRRRMEGSSMQTMAG
jgi:hypothetical protein